MQDVRCTINRRSLLTRTDQNRLPLALASLWKLIAGLAGSSCRSKAVVLTAFCSSPVSRARLSVKVSAMRNSMVPPLTLPGTSDYLRSQYAKLVVGLSIP